LHRLHFVITGPKIKRRQLKWAASAPSHSLPARASLRPPPSPTPRSQPSECSPPAHARQNAVVLVRRGAGGANQEVLYFWIWVQFRVAKFSESNLADFFIRFVTFNQIPFGK